MTTLSNNKATLKDVAKMANVSIATASMALADHPDINEGTKRRIRLLCRKLNYQRPVDKVLKQERAKGRRKAMRFGFMSLGIRLSDEIITDFMNELILHATSSKTRMEVSCVENTKNHKEVLQQVLFFSQDLDGIILQGLVEDDLIRGIESEHIPYVIYGHTMNKNATIGTIVALDEIGMGRLAAHQLIDCGHQRIGFVAEKLYPGLWAQNWLNGYRLALINADLGIEADLMHIAGRTFAGGKPAAQAFSNMEEPPSAYVIPDVRVAASFITEMANCGSRASKASIIIGGNKDIAIRYHIEDYPLVTTNTKIMAQSVAQRLVQIIERPPISPTTLLIPFDTQNFPCPEMDQASQGANNRLINQ